MCTKHWTELRAAIEARGLMGLVAKDGHDAVARMKTELESGASRTTFDPLMSAHNAIVSNVIKTAGLGPMGAKEDGSEWCPLCYVIETCACGRGDGCPFHTWIGHAADDAKEAAIKLGLVGGA